MLQLVTLSNVALQGPCRSILLQWWTLWSDGLLHEASLSLEAEILEDFFVARAGRRLRLVELRGKGDVLVRLLVVGPGRGWHGAGIL